MSFIFVFLAEAGVDGLECTKSWLQRSYDVLKATETEPSNQSLPSESSTNQNQVLSAEAANSGQASLSAANQLSASPSPSANQTPASPSSSANQKPGSMPVSPSKLLNNAYLELLDWPENLLFPEVCYISQIS